MKEIVLFSGALYGALVVILGAFGAHALKKTFTDDQMKSFETGIKYQMYHALVLLLMGFELDFLSGIEKIAGWSFIVGILLFSFSIYGLCYTAAKGKKARFLGPVTPHGGLLLLLGWVLLIFIFV